MKQKPTDVYSTTITDRTTLSKMGISTSATAED